MPSQTVRGAWAEGSAGGCPRNHETWTSNPQFLLLPSGEGTFSITLRCANTPKLDIGFVVLQQDGRDKAGRKTGTMVKKKELIFKTKWRTTDTCVADVPLPAPEQGRGFIILPCTFDAGHLAPFEIQVTSSAAEFTLMPIGEQPPAAPAAAPVATGGGAAAVTTMAAPTFASSAGGGGGGDGGGAAAAYPNNAALTEDGGGAAEGEVVESSEGKGLSAKQKREAADLVQLALASCSSSPSGLYEDAEFPPSAKSLWIDGAGPGEALRNAGIDDGFVTRWRRPSEFAPPLAGTHGPARLFYSDWGVQGVVASPLLDHWLLAACNIVGGDVEILEKVFVDMEHSAQGFYVVRFYVDDPNSDDDWQVVLVDDRLPCGADGMPCFARCPSPVVLWVSIIEKAFAKFKGSYEATGGGSVEDGLLYLTGGLSREMGIAPSSDAAMKDMLWQMMMEWWMSAHVIGCEHRIDSEPSAELTATGLLPNTPYCVVTGGEPDSAGRMVRLRTFHGYSEWKGKWSDKDASWTSQLRQTLAYHQDSDDGTFWMSFDDFVLWFNVLFTCRMADDRWSTLSTKSRWVDATAGGCPPNFATWRCNPQWLLKTSKPVKLTVSLSTPQPPPPADGGVAPLFSPDAAIGITVLRGNFGQDARRRKLLLTEPADLVVRSEPRPTRRLVTQIGLEASEVPYILMPHTFMPGKESAFTMTVRADDEDDDGNADFSLEPVRPDTDWHTASRQEKWKEALERGAKAMPAADDDENASGNGGGAILGGAPGSAGFGANPQVSLLAKKGGRFWVFVDQVGLSPDGESYPAVGVGLTPGSALDDGVIERSELLQNEGPSESDSVVFACELEAAETPYVIMPFLADPATALAKHPRLTYRVVVYADQPFALGDPNAPATGASSDPCANGKCVCWGLGKHPDKQTERSCVMLKVYNSLRRMEAGLDRQLKYLSTLQPHESLGEAARPTITAQP